MIVTRVSKEEWAEKFYAAAHAAVFKEFMGPDDERISFAILVIDPEKDEPIMYATICEPKKDSAYINYGGSFPPYRGSTKAVKAFKKIVSELFETHSEISYHCENINVPMLKLGIKSGFRVIGLTYTKSHKILLEHSLERDRYYRQTRRS